MKHINNFLTTVNKVSDLLMYRKWKSYGQDSHLALILQIAS